MSDHDILEAARASLLAYGPSVSVAEIARRVGLSGPAVLKRFGSKETLVARALLPSGPKPDWSRGPDPGPLRPQLVAMLHRAEQLLSEAAPRLAALRAGGVELSRWLNDSPPRRARRALHTWLEKARRTHGLSHPDLEAAADLLVSLVEARGFLAWAEPTWVESSDDWAARAIDAVFGVEGSAAAARRPTVSRRSARSTRRIGVALGSHVPTGLLAAAVLAGLSFGCTGGSSSPAADEPEPVRVDVVRAEERPVVRYVTVTGTLTAEEQAEVAAEIAGRVVSTPVERGTAVAAGSALVRIDGAEAEAQAREAEANAAQIQARLGQPAGEAFDIDRVPEVASAAASRDLAEREFERARTLFDQQLVPAAEYEQRRAQAENARRQYDVARNAAEQQRQALAAALARVALARKAVEDTVVRAPFAGLVGERLVSVGDYVTRGTKVASVVRINPLRVQLTVPAQYIASVGSGQSVALTVDGFPGETFPGEVRYLSPAVDAASRALLVEASVPNGSGRLRPGLFVSARIEQAVPTPGVLVPSAAVRTVAGTSRVFVVAGDRVEERIVTLGQTVGPLVEAATGLQAGEPVATGPLAQLADGTRIVAP